MAATSDEPLFAVLTRSREAGFLGPGPVEDHLGHARTILGALPAGTRTFLDLGSGGGIPGLVIANDRPDWHGVLLDGSTRRGAFLREALRELGFAGRIDVWVERAEAAGRRLDARAHFDVVVARSFGAPPVVAECAAPLLRTGGTLVVSDPPDGGRVEDRWPAEGLAQLGLRVERSEAGRPAYTVLQQEQPCPDRYPRRVGVPGKRPLF